jgi:hypothetical protein
MPSAIRAGELIAAVNLWLRSFLGHSQRGNHANQNRNAQEISHHVSLFEIAPIWYYGVFELGGITLAVSTNPQALDRQQVLTSMLQYWSKSGK